MGIIVTKFDDLSGPFSFPHLFSLSDAMFHFAHVPPRRHFTGTHVQTGFHRTHGFAWETRFNWPEMLHMKVRTGFPHS